VADDSVKSILLVCTGNILRSLVAGYALKRHLDLRGSHYVGSAGGEAKPQSIHPPVRDGSWSVVLTQPGTYNAS
jgi:protein-tyrosine-phosphatase